MRIGRCYDKRHHGGPRPTWRPSPAFIVRGAGEPLARALRIETNRQIKKLRLVFK